MLYTHELVHSNPYFTIKLNPHPAGCVADTLTTAFSGFVVVTLIGSCLVGCVTPIPYLFTCGSMCCWCPIHCQRLCISIFYINDEVVNTFMKVSLVMKHSGCQRLFFREREREPRRSRGNEAQSVEGKSSLFVTDSNFCKAGLRRKLNTTAT